MRTKKTIIVLRDDQEIFRLSKGVELSEQVFNSMLELWKTDTDKSDVFYLADEEGKKEWYGMVKEHQSWLRINNRFKWNDWFTDFDD